MTATNLPHIRLATQEDIPVLCDLLGLLFAQEAEFTPDVSAQKRGLTRIIEQADIGRILVICQQGQIVGMVNLSFP